MLDPFLPESGDPETNGYLVPKASYISRAYLAFLQSVELYVIATEAAFGGLKVDPDSHQQELLITPDLEAALLEARKQLTQSDRQLIRSWNKARKVSRSSAEFAISNMYVVALVSTFEAFIQDLLFAIFVAYPASLKSQKTITYEEVLDSLDASAIIETLARREAKSATDGPVNVYLMRLAKKFNVHELPSMCSTPLDWVFTLRHCIVHNSARIDQKALTVPIVQDIHPGAVEGSQLRIEIEALSIFSQVVVLSAGLLEAYLVHQKYKKVAVVRWGAKCVTSESSIRSIFTHYPSIY